MFGLITLDFRRIALAVIAGAILAIPALVTPERADGATYGPWFPPPGSGQNGVAYQTDVAPFNDSNIAEISNFSCITGSGRPIGNKEKKVLSQIFSAAGLVFKGRWDVESGSDTGFDGISARDLDSIEQQSGQGAGSNKDTLDNGSYPEGTRGMQEFLRQEMQLLREGHWVYFHHRDIDTGNQDASNPGDYTLPNGVVVNVDEANFGQVGSPARQRKMAALLDPGARHPLELTKGLPEGCTLQTLTPPPPSFGGLLSNPGDQVTNLLLYVPGKIASSLYDLVSPYAFKFTFWTPHSERGDVMWSIPSTCTPTSSMSNRKRRQIADACAGGRGGDPLGYRKSTRDVKNQHSWYLNIARFMQWMISGLYFLILFTAATLFIFRGNRTTNMNLMKVLPRLILSMILTVFSGFVIGAVISFANLLVQAIFDQNDVWTVGGVNAFLLQADNIVGGGMFIGQLVQIVVGVCTVFFFTMFVVGSLLRQLVLIGLVVLAPVAIFCLINDGWKQNFDRWVRALLAVAFTPVVLALIFKMGMSVNPLVLDPVGAYGNLSGFLGLVMMLATLWAMNRVLKSVKNFVMTQSGAAAGVEGAGKGVERLGGALPGRAGTAISVAGGALAHQGGSMGDNGGSLIPGNRAMGGGSSPAAASRPVRHLGPSPGSASPPGAAPSRPPGALPAAVTAFGRKIGGDKVAAAMGSWMNKRRGASLAQKGVSEISQADYMDKKSKAEAAIKKGKDPKDAIGGEVYEEKGRFYFRSSGETRQLGDRSSARLRDPEGSTEKEQSKKATIARKVATTAASTAAPARAASAAASTAKKTEMSRALKEAVDTSRRRAGVQRIREDVKLTTPAQGGVGSRKAPPTNAAAGGGSSLPPKSQSKGAKSKKEAPTPPTPPRPSGDKQNRPKISESMPNPPEISPNKGTRQTRS